MRPSMAGKSHKQRKKLAKVVAAVMMFRNVAHSNLVDLLSIRAYVVHSGVEGI